MRAISAASQVLPSGRRCDNGSKLVSSRPSGRHVLTTNQRPRAETLIGLAQALLEKAALPPEKASLVAELLVEADLMGHTTHGLNLLAGYLGALDDGKMTATGDVEVIADHGSTLVWDGRYLPGVWLTAKAIDTAVARAESHGLASVSIRKSHHIACLATFLERATRHDMMVLLLSSDPAAASVAPFGGTRPVMTPNPIGIGIPTGGDPILIDVSASITTNGLSGRLAKEGKRFEHPWLLDGAGLATNDPAVLQADPPGSILPIGGLDHGHKGTAIGLWVEVMTQALAGFGRADGADRWGASVFVQVIDPKAFAGRDAFVRQTGWLAEAVTSNPPRPGVEAVRLPGQRGLQKKREALQNGVDLYPGILDSLRAEALKRDVPWPTALG
ncbi:MAG: Ldh family oxidoreductase [Geminicoccaceae bacterium]|nr:MAG: Ldh family oxidoreductase [Geminicoccaceae bacterium]